mgnify:CR=1 FL=1
MKKRSITLKYAVSAIVLIFILSCFYLPAIAAVPKVIINGTELKIDTNPVVIDGRTLVPLRGIFEALGATVYWDSNTKTITAQKNGATIKLTIGQNTALKNGAKIHLDVSPKIISGRTMVPLRFVAEALGAQVSWDGKTNTVNIQSQDEKTTQNRIAARVVRVIDGDTVEVEIDGKRETVRMIGVDTPETVHPEKEVEYYGKEASNFTKSKLEGKDVQLELDVQERDRYGRLLAYIWVGGELFNETLVKEGYAKVSTYPPNVKYVDRFTAAEREAREAGRGLWAGQNEQPVKTTGKYVGSIESNKYHLPTCRWAEQIKPENRIWFDSEEEAQKAGYEPCKVCNP